MYTTLVEAADLARRLADARLAVLDCRYELSRPDWGERAYAAGHIPNALHASLDSDLSGKITPDTGRHPLPDPKKFMASLARWGIDREVQVVAYDQGNGAFAARLWWMLRWVGHQQAAVLNGGLAAWQELGLPVTSEPGSRAQRNFAGRAANAMVVTTAQVQRGLERKAITLVDARGADRFAGENETIDPVAGHVPGARNRPFVGNVDARGRFLSAAELRAGWDTLLRGQPAERVVAMCGSGVTACHNLLALEIADLTGARLYAGSWSEWIRDPGRPIARGP
jgi:thiosulfate/3-mercaptopyruvate sulfurtransferase